MNWFEKPKPATYYKQAEEIFAWNAVAGTTITLEQQGELVIEEAKELYQAILEQKAADVLKEACDLFVVTSFYWKILSYKEKILWPQSNQITNYSLKSLSDEILYYTESEERVLACSTLLGLAIDVLNLIDADSVGALECVNTNNWSKFVFSPLRPMTHEEIKAEAEAIENKSAGRYKGVQGFQRNEFILWKDNKNKILKPTWHSPVDLSVFVDEKWLATAY